ncbi:unnamed protein product [Tenebrio molitor]|nr:unnamed protein product [Tenebrio molitor]
MATLAFKSEETKTPWGRLLPCWSALPQQDLIDSSILFGTSWKCDVNLDIFSSFPDTCIEINRDNRNYSVYITDTGEAGAVGIYVNGGLLEKNKTAMLFHNDVIAFNKRNYNIYVFKMLLTPNDNSNNLCFSLQSCFVLGCQIYNDNRKTIDVIFDKKTSGEYLLKKLPKSNDFEKNFRFTRWKLKRNPFLLQMIRIDQNFDDFFVVTPNCRCGNLLSRMDTALNDAEAKLIFFQATAAVRYLHCYLRIYHGRLKPENLMICYVGHIPLVKVADFGLAEILAETEPPISGEADFVAPELVGYTSRFSQSADIWSLGEILYYMMFKELPFRESGVSRQAMIREFPVERHFEGVFDIGVISNLLCGMMEVAIDERMDIVTVWRHDWFAKDNHLQKSAAMLLKNLSSNSN